jgi:Baseplate J-like protein
MSTMSCSGASDCTCGCCAGIGVQTPQQPQNLPMQPAISYRIGSWNTFKDSMLARLSSSDYPSLAGLKTRSDDDFTIAFLDAGAMLMDILTFYQERLANEQYLRTATQLRSLTELSRVIGYQPAPGVSASTYLAFTLKVTPGLPPDPTTAPIIIPAATQAQSVPAQGQTPQTFETAVAIPAKPDWNALPVQTGSAWLPKANDTSLYLAGSATQLQPGDLFLIVGDERTGSTASNNWDIRQISAVTVDTTNNRTYVTWAEGLGSAHVSPAQQHPKFYVFRQRAALFGYNAPQPRLLDTKNTSITTLSPSLLNSGQTEWSPFGLTTQIDTDSSYPKVVKGSWVAMIAPDNETSRTPPGQVGLYQVASVSTITRSEYALSAKITRVYPDLTSNLGSFPLRSTIVLVQSEQLSAAEQPLDHPLYGTIVDLATLRPDLQAATVIAVIGTRQKVCANTGVSNLQFVPDDPTAAAVTLDPGQVFTLTDPTPLPSQSSGVVPAWTTYTKSFTMKVLDASGRPGTVQAATSSAVPLLATQFSLLPPGGKDPEVSEYALVSQVIATADSSPHTQIQLASPLLNCYCRLGTTVNANVAPATAGQSVSEVLGNGSASTANQSFTLRQNPLTYVQAATPTGRQSSLQVLANQVPWTEVATLYGQKPTSTAYMVLNQSDGSADVLCGDGVEGATLPTGQNNIRANYRIGSGSAGNVATGAISTLMQRPLGVSGVSNPGPATGGQDPQSVEDIRANAPQGVLTLGRAVSITDYQNYAATFAGIAKANAIWIPNGPGRGVFLTVAAVGGVGLQPGNPTLDNLTASLGQYGNPLIPVSVATFVETLFGFTAQVAYAAAATQSAVEAQILKTLYQTFNFTQRSFGQGVSADEIAALIQGVAGVVAVNVTQLTVGPSSYSGDLANMNGGFTVSNWQNWTSRPATVTRPNSGSPNTICPYVPVASNAGLPVAAEILVLDPNPNHVVLGVMS